MENLEKGTSLDVAEILKDLDPVHVERALELAKKIKERRHSYKIDSYDPYPFQQEFHATGASNNQRLLMCANRIGKSYSGAAEIAMHLTGLYPEWWKGRVYKKGITAWAGGVSNETTRDIVQFELLASPDDPDAFGTGTVPIPAVPVRVYHDSWLLTTTCTSLWRDAY